MVRREKITDLPIADLIFFFRAKRVDGVEDDAAKANRKSLFHFFLTIHQTTTTTRYAFVLPNKSKMLRASSRLFSVAATAASAAVTAATPPSSHFRIWKGEPLSSEFLEDNKRSAQSLYKSKFTVSDRCWERIVEKNRIESIANSDRFLRLAVESGGCHGFVYKFQFDDSLDKEEDVMFFADECREIVGGDVEAKIVVDRTENDAAAAAASPSSPPIVVVDKSTAECLEGATLDYHMELKGSAFVVVGNEKVDHLCACAMSFSVSKKK